MLKTSRKSQSEEQGPGNVDKGSTHLKYLFNI